MRVPNAKIALFFLISKMIQLGATKFPDDIRY